MFRNTRLPYEAATRLGNKLLVKFQSWYHLVLAAFVAVLLLGVASPAQAAETSVVKAADAPNFMCYIGTPSLEVFNPAQSATQKITGIILGLVIAAGFIGVIVGGIRIALAGKHADKAGDGVKQVSNSVIGVTVVFGGLLIFGIIVVVLVSLVSFSCS